MNKESSFIVVDKEVREKAIKEKGRTTNKGRPCISEELKDKITIQYNNGNTLKDIAKELDISLSTVCKVIRERTI